MKRWNYVLLPFHSKITVINTFFILYITFYSPILNISQRNGKTFLQLVKEFLWRNKTGKANPWQWGKWQHSASPRSLGGLGIINHEVHATALCAKFWKESEAMASSSQEALSLSHTHTQGEALSLSHSHSYIEMEANTFLHFLLLKHLVHKERVIHNIYVNPKSVLKIRT